MNHLNPDRRDTLRQWAAEVGYLYLLVAALVALAFLLGDLRAGAVVDVRPVASTAGSVDPIHPPSGPPSR